MREGSHSYRQTDRQTNISVSVHTYVDKFVDNWTALHHQLSVQTTDKTAQTLH